MTKNKNRQSAQNKQRLTEAQYRNDFYKRLSNFCKALTGEDVVSLIPPFNLNLIYMSRSRPITAVAAEGHDVPHKYVEAIQIILNSQLRKIDIPIEKTNRTIPLSDFYLLGLPLYVHIFTMEHLHYKNDQNIKALLQDTCGNLDYLFDLIYDNLYDHVFTYMILITNNFVLHYFSYHFEILTVNKDLGVKFVVQIKKYPPEKIYLNVDNNYRAVYRIGWTFKADDFEWIFVKPSQLQMHSETDQEKIPVYIQMHALQRLMERIDCIHPANILSGLYVSLREFAMFRDHHRYIIEFKVVNVKVGYLSAIMVEGKLVIRTFLFITFNGTPEGKRLEEFVGLKKLDTKYLQMDKLSSFMSRKLKSNDELRSIFEKADCLHLVELYDKLDQFSQVHRENSPIEILVNYLKNNDIHLDEWAVEPPQEVAQPCDNDE